MGRFPHCLEQFWHQEVASWRLAGVPKHCGSIRQRPRLCRGGWRPALLELCLAGLTREEVSLRALWPKPTPPWLVCGRPHLLGCGRGRCAAVLGWLGPREEPWCGDCSHNSGFVGRVPLPSEFASHPRDIAEEAEGSVDRRRGDLESRKS